MQTRPFPLYSIVGLMLGILLLAACSPTFDWREVRGTDVPFVVLLPAKPASLARPVNIGGATVTMTMTAAEVDGVTFAVGTAEMPDAASAKAAVTSMKEALVRNINGNIQREAALAAPASGIEIEALGPPAAQGGQARLMLARFMAQDKRVYQVLVLGPEKKLTPETAETFLASFKPAP